MGKASEFAGRAVVIATMHGKEKWIGPVMEAALGVRVVTPKQPFDTDFLGTFSGEVERLGTAEETVRLKCMLGLNAVPDASAAVASEGSFGPHPEVAFVAANRECVMWRSCHTGREVVGQHFTWKTNYAVQEIEDAAVLEAFAKRAKFPSHALILKGASGVIRKGICTDEQLRDAWRELRALRPGEPITAMTDMRAMHNPTRRVAIVAATWDLVKRLQTPCPACGLPGTGLARWIPGLPCAWCGTPTARPLAAVHQCPHCHWESIHDSPAGEAKADPGECPQCNP